jgi:signal peptidase I
MIKIIKNTGIWLLIALVVLLFATIIAQLFGIQRYLVVSGSMEPSLYAGDMVFVNSNVDFEDVQLGDVIIFSTKI